MNMCKSLILDTDLDTDCDDVGALAVAGHLVRDGKIDLQAVICSTPFPEGAGFARQMLDAIDLTEIPVGLVSEDLWKPVPTYEAYLAHRDTHRQKNMLYNEVLCQQPPASVTDAVDLYRLVLEQSEDHSVTICAIGTLTVLAELQRKEPDLVSQKVDRLVCMARANFPAGKDSFNWRMDFPAAVQVIHHWPTPVYVQESGAEVKTGHSFADRLPEEHPLRQAYALFLKGFGEPARASWDQLTLLFAADARPEFFKVEGPLGLTLNQEDGLHQWNEIDFGLPRYHVETSADSEKLRDWVEDCMSG